MHRRAHTAAVREQRHRQTRDLVRRTTALPPELRGRVYAHLGENTNTLNRLRALERHDPVARERRRAVTDPMATRGLRRLLGDNPRGDRSSDDPADWTLDENPRVYVASLVGKLVPAMTAAMRIARGVAPVPPARRLRLRVAVQDDGDGESMYVIEDSRTSAVVQLRARVTMMAVRYDLYSTSVVLDAPRHRRARITNFIGGDSYTDEAGPGLGNFGNSEDRTVYHRCLDIATQLAIRRARQIVDAES